MGKYEDFISELQKDFEVPTEVSRNMDSTLNSLPEVSASKRGKSKVRKWITAIASTAAALALCIGVLAANPVLAAKIPLIGKIFVRVGDRVTYSGDFQDKGEMLMPEGTEPVEVTVDSDVAGEATGAASEETNATYTASDKGMTFTASEVYCDGHSLYLTAKIESQDGGFTDMTGYAADDGNGERVKRMYAWGGGQTNQGIVGENEGQSLEGDIIDDNTFVGMMKIDLAQATSGEGVFDLELTMLGFDGQKALQESDSIDVTNRYDGNWKLSIPYTVDTEDVKMVEVNETAEGGFDINQVFVSPYQVIIYLNAPYTDVTAENFEEVYGEFNEELVASGQEAITFEDGGSEAEIKEKEMLAAGMESSEIEKAMSNRYYHEFELAAFNQQDEKLDWQGATLVGDQWVAKYAVKGLNISKLQLFLGDGNFTVIKANDVNEAKANSIWNTEIDVK